MMNNSRKGSALLIVLGMLAFMIASAVAFAAYMRYARMPSSYLRRTTATRELTKAALARAIDEIDLAIGNNPYPGVGNLAAGRHDMNRFVYGVYAGDPSTSEEAQRNILRDQTASVLTLEGLAYIPPHMVNDARYYGREVPSAQWKSFDFDAGRYAFIALNVSDCLDVNRLCANISRSSAGNSRLSLAYLFENETHSSAGTGADEWDDSFMSQFRSFNKDTREFDFKTKVPLVSMADFNLALGENGVAGLYSPWCRYLNAQGGTGFYGGGTEGIANASKLTFVTDGFFPAAKKKTGNNNDEDEEYDLADEENQPFTIDKLKSPNQSFVDLIRGQGFGAGYDGLRDSVSILGMCALWDYLDADSIPVSLAVPTVERAPMICGIDIVNPAGFEFKVKHEWKPEPAGNIPDPATSQLAERQAEAELIYTIDADMFGQSIGKTMVNTLVAYPFCRDDGADEGTFELEGNFALFFSSGEMTLRTSENDVLHYGNFKNATQAGLDNNGVMMMPFIRKEKLSFKAKNITKEEEAVRSISKDLGQYGDYLGSQLNGKVLLKVKYRWTQTRKSDGMGNYTWQPQYSLDKLPGDEYIVSAETQLPALKANGTVDRDISNPTTLGNTLKGGSTVTMSLNAAIWLAVKNTKENKYVDLVPACIRDDNDLNSAGGEMPEELASDIAGSSYPLMRFDTSLKLILSTSAEITGSVEDLAKKDSVVKITLSPEKVVVDDPRYNHIVEDWYEPAWDVTKENWLDKCVHERTNDIFLNTSDQCYLQSIYELAFLPRLTDLKGFGADQVRGNFVRPQDGRKKLSNGNKGPGQAVHEKLMWQTYDPFDQDAQAFEDLGYVSSGSGIKVNPYSSCTNVLMAAFANTPLDWRCASTNDTGKGEDMMALTAKEFNSDYAWNEYSSGPHIAYGDLENIAMRFSALTRDRKDWKAAWRDLGWRNDNEDKLCGVTLGEDTDDLWDIDRKFFYGYWRDCFAPKQQLFLIFVRAEPLMMGGGAMDKIPPQLGGRAVALVWRDPTENTTSPSGRVATNEGYPHRTRVLFYKPLD